MCVGAENESEAVGDAQQVGDFLFIPQRTKMLSGFALVHTRKKPPPPHERCSVFCCRHPVRHVRFNTSTLVTANIPDDKSPRGACITDDDLTAHRRSLPFT